MAGEKIRGAEAAAKAFIDLLGPGDSLSALIFGAVMDVGDIRMGPQGKEQAKRCNDHLIATGNTALYEAIDEAYQFLLARDPSRTRALIVLSDGKDIKPSPSLEKLFDKLDRANRSAAQSSSSQSCTAMMPTRKHCASLAKRTNGKYYKGSPSFPGIERRENIDSIHKVFTDLATFF